MKKLNKSVLFILILLTLVSPVFQAIPAYADGEIAIGTDHKGGALFTTPAGAEANAWQIVDQAYSGCAVANKILSTDGNYRVQKNVIPTGVENEFYVYMSIDVKGELTEYFQEAQYVATSSNNYHSSDLGQLVASMTGNQSIIVSGDPSCGYSNSAAFTILDCYGNTVLNNKKLYWSSSNNCTFYLKTGNNQYILLALQVKKNETPAAVQLSKEATDAVYADVNAVTNVTVSDEMGSGGTGMSEWIEFIEVVAGDYSTTPTCTNGILNWEPVFNNSAEQVKTSTEVWFCNASQLVYKVRLKTDLPDFESCAAVLPAGQSKTASSSYKVNNSASLSKGGTKMVEFPVPYVRGVLYEAEIHKTDDSGNALSGAGFTFTRTEKFQASSDGLYSNISPSLSGSSGDLKVVGIPAGTYTISETTVPQGYTASADPLPSLTFNYTANPSGYAADGDYLYAKNASGGHSIVEIENVSAEVTVTTDAVNGTITKTGTYLKGGNAAIVYSPKPGYVLDKITVDEEPVSTKTYASGYSFSNITEDHEIKVEYKLAVSAEKSVDKASAQAGETLTYTITLKNDSAEEVTVSSVSDTLSSNLTDITAEGAVISDRTVSWSDVKVPAGGTKALTISAKVIDDLASAAEINNTFSAKFDGKDLTPNTTETSASPAPLFAVKYVYMDGSETPAGTTPPTDSGSYRIKTEFLEGAKYNASSETGVTGYSFDGWYLKSGDGYVKYVNGTEIDDSLLDSLKVLNLYGKWHLSRDVSITKEASDGILPIAADIPVSAGSKVTYVITVKNNSAGTVSNVKVSDPLPEDFTFVSADNGGSCPSDTVSWTVASLAAGEEKALSVTVTLPEIISQNTEYTNVAKITEIGGEVPETPPEAEAKVTATPILKTVTTSVVNGSITPSVTVPKGSNAAIVYSPKPGYVLDKITVDEEPVSTDTHASGYSFSNITEDHEIKVEYKLAVSAEKSVDKASAYPGDILVFTITVKNDSDSDITLTSVSDVLPASLTDVAAVSPAGATVSGNTISWSNVSVEKNGSTLLKLQAKVASTVAEGDVIENTASVEFDGKTINTDKTETAAALKYTITTKVENGTIDPTASFDKGESYTVSYSPNPGYVLDSVKVDGNSASAYPTSYPFENITGDHEISVKYKLAVSSSKSVDKNTAVPGSVLEFTIKVKNDSASAISLTSVSDTLPDVLTNVAAVSPEGATVSGNTVVWSDVAVPANGSTELKLRGTVISTLADAVDIENTASVVFDGKTLNTNKTTTKAAPVPKFTVKYAYMDGSETPAGKERPKDVDSDDAYNKYPVGSSYSAISETGVTGYTFDGWYINSGSGLTLFTNGTEIEDSLLDSAKVLNLYGKWHLTRSVSVSKDAFFGGASVKGGSVAAGSTLTYVISVTNNSAAAVGNVVVTDSLPAGLTFESADNGGTCSSGTVSWTISSLASGETKALSVNATIPSDIKVETDYENTASVSSVDGETPSGTLSDTAKVTGMPLPYVFSIFKSWSDTWQGHEPVMVQGYDGSGAPVWDEPKEISSSEGISFQLPRYTAEGEEISYTFAELDSNGSPVSSGGSLVISGSVQGSASGTYAVAYENRLADEGKWLITNTYQIVPEDLSFAKTALDSNGEPVSSLAAGDVFHYRITVTNNRSYETASGIVVQDVLPAGLILDTSSLPASAVVSNTGTPELPGQDVVTWTIDSLGPGNTATLDINVTVPETMLDEYTNTAYITRLGPSTYENHEYPSGKDPVIVDVRSFTASKVWEDELEQNAHGPISVQLLMDGEPYGEAFSLSADNGWTNTWDRLPLFSQGKYHAYTVSELQPGPAYSVDYSYLGDAEKGNTGVTVTNSLRYFHANYVFVGSEKPDNADDLLPFGPMVDTLNGQDTTLIPYGAKYDAVSTAGISAKGFSFSGWYTDDGCTVFYDRDTYNSGAGVTDDFTLYGLWTRNKVTVTPQFKGNPPPGFENLQPEQLNQFDQLAVPGDPNAENPVAGYRFDGWFSDPDCTIPYVKSEIENDIPIYGLWTRLYNLSYQFVGTAPSGAVLPEGTTLDEGDVIVPADGPKVTAYTFDGWYTDPGCTVKFVPGSTISADTVLYGKYAADKTPAAKTGDDNSPGLWLALAVFSINGLGAVTVIAKKKSKT